VEKGGGKTPDAVLYCIAAFLHNFNRDEGEKIFGKLVWEL
jgi:hypothetical protein